MRRSARIETKHFQSKLPPIPGRGKALQECCLSSIILSPLNGNVKLSPYETGDIHVESEGTAKSERHQRVHQGRHGVYQSRRTPVSERAPGETLEEAYA